MKQEAQEKEKEDICFEIRLTKTTIVVIIITIIKHHRHLPPEPGTPKINKQSTYLLVIPLLNHLVC